MPTTLKDAPAGTIAQDPPRKRWTRAEIEAIEPTGIWSGQHLELIEGELVNKMPKNFPHVLAVAMIAKWLRRVFGEDRIHQEAPIDVAPQDNPSSAPEPDLIVLNHDMLEMRGAPQPADLQLIVEVSDSTLHFDVTTKANLYARAGIREYWVADLPARRLIVHRDPEQGRYRTVIAFSENESVAPLASPNSSLSVGDILPPVA